MRTFPAVTIPSLLLFNGVTAQACAVGMAQEINGNWYCSEVTAVTYTDFPGFGFYEKITDMDADSGICSSERYNYSGSLSLLNEEVLFLTSLNVLILLIKASVSSLCISAAPLG